MGLRMSERVHKHVENIYILPLSLSIARSLSLSLSLSLWGFMKQHEYNIMKQESLKVLCRSCDLKAQEDARIHQTKLISTRCSNKTWQDGKA